MAIPITIGLNTTSFNPSAPPLKTSWIPPPTFQPTDSIPEPKPEPTFLKAFPIDEPIFSIVLVTLLESFIILLASSKFTLLRKFLYFNFFFVFLIL